MYRRGTQFHRRTEVGYGRDAYWQCKHVELNAMTSPQFIAWLERKFAEHGVEKVIPDDKTLAEAWQRARRIAALNRSIRERVDELNQKKIEVPENLAARIHEENEEKQRGFVGWHPRRDGEEEEKRLTLAR
jgi:predicted transcriptional regulator